MIDVTIDCDTALIHVVSGALDVTYEVKPTELRARRRTYYTSHLYAHTGKQGYAFDLVGSVRSARDDQPPYIFAAMDFESVVRRGLAKARHLERVWSKTAPRRSEVAA